MISFRKLTYALIGSIISIVFSTCTPEESPCGQTTSGFGSLLNTYVFWMDNNYGQMKVEVKDSKGEIQDPENDLISQYYPMATNPTPDCSSSGKQNNAVFKLSPGKKYTFKAYNNNYSFNGSLNLTCDGGQCIFININSN